MLPDYETNARQITELKSHIAELELQVEELQVVEREFEKFQNKYLDLYNAAPVGYITLSKGCVVLEANQTAAKLLGLGLYQLKGASLYSLISPEDKELFFFHLMAVFEREVTTACELKFRRADGSEFDAELRSLAEKGENGVYNKFRTVLSDISERKQSEEFQKKLRKNLESLWQLSRIQGGSLKSVADYILEEIKSVSESRYAFYGFINDAEDEMEIHSWSRNAMKQCAVDDKPRVFPIHQAGVWADCVRKRQSVIINDYGLDHEAKRGTPEGHVELTRLVSIPVFSKGKVVAIGVVANKNSEYTEDDVRHLESLLAHAQIIAEQKRWQAATEENELKFRTVAEFTYDWEYWIRPDGSIAYMSPSCERITGYARQEFLYDPYLLQKIVHPDDQPHAGNCMTNPDSGPPCHLEFRIITPKGDTIWIGHNCQAVYGEKGQWLGRRVSNREITKRKLAEQAVQRSEERYRLIVETASEGFWAMDGFHVTTAVNRKMLEMLGFSAEEMVGRRVEDFMFAEDLQQHASRMTDRHHGRVGSYETRFRRKDGSTLWTLVAATPFLDETGSFNGSFALFTDITERKKAEDTLRESERVLSTLINNLPGFVYRCANDRDWTMEYISDGCLEITGYAPDDFVSNRNIAFNDVVHPDYRKYLWEKWQEVLGNQCVFEEEYPIISRTGEIRWLWERGRGVFSEEGQLLFLEGFITDISERKRVEEALRQSERFLRQSEKIARIGGWKANPHTNSLHWTEGVYDIIEAPLSYLPNFQAGGNFFIPEHRPVVLEAITRTLETGSPFRLEAQVFTTGGKLKWTEVRGLMRVEDGQQPCVVGSFQDITERKMSEEAIRISEDRFGKAFHLNPDAITISRLEDGMIVSVNEGFMKLFGAAEDEIVGRTSVELNMWVRPEDRNILIEGLQLDGYFNNLEMNLLKKNGEIFAGLVSGAIIDFDGVKHILCIVKDITERRVARERLFQAQKMEAIGALASGFAHDFNNKLHIIRGYLDLVALNGDLSQIVRSDLRTIEKTADSCAELIKGMMALGRKTSGELQTIQLNNVVEQLVSLFSPVMPPVIHMNTVLDNDLWKIIAVPGQIDQILMNLTVNARDAMPDGGNLVIQTRNMILDTDFCSAYQGRKPGRYIQLSVSDSGHGIDAETQPRIFEPFFTTKEKGKGSGLGLAVVHGIVEQLNGIVACQSEVTSGTTFSIYLPAIQ